MKRTEIFIRGLWAVFAVVSILIIWGYFSGGYHLEEQTKTTEPPREKTRVERRTGGSTTYTPEKPKTFAEREVTEGIVKNEIYKVIDNISKIEVADYPETEDPDDKMIDITYSMKSAWDAKDYVRKSCDNAVEVMEKLFKNPAVGRVGICMETTFTDAYGKESKEPAVKLAMKRETAKKVEWSSFKEMVLVDYNNLLNIIDYSYIHPGMAKNL